MEYKLPDVEDLKQNIPAIIYELCRPHIREGHGNKTPRSRAEVTDMGLAYALMMLLEIEERLIKLEVSDAKHQN